MNLRSVNLVPYQGSAIVNGRIDYSEIILNILAFVPFGIYLSMLPGLEHSFWKKVLPIAGVSLGYEIMQYILSIGATDITDWIGNTLGGILGIGAYLLIRMILKKKTNKVLCILAAAGTICLVLLIGMLLFVNR